jgi:predicted O-methyltransferase YrrM
MERNLRSECWLTEKANEFLDFFIKERNQVSVLEFGMGASTLWFIKQLNVASVVSIEHDIEWFSYITAEGVKISNILDVKFQSYCEPMPYNWLADEMEDNIFDIVLVDGRNRNKCIQSAIHTLSPKGILILDNSERDYYCTGMELMKGWKSVSYKQIEPDKYGFTYPDWTTTIFIKP